MPFNKLVTLILSLSGSGTNQGVDTKAGLLFKNARRCGLWPDTPTVHRSTITKARAKIPWNVFQTILSDAVKAAYDLWPQDEQRYQWKGMSVYATDGSPYNLPATDDIRRQFDPQSGLQNKGKGHYPQCLVSTVYDVFRRLPIARTVVDCNGCERQQIARLLPSVAPHSVWMFDRGYPSYATINYLTEHYDGFFLFRAPATQTFNVVRNFIKSGKKEDIIWITPSHDFKRKVSLTERKKLKPVKLRVIRLQSADGTLSVLLTNLFGKNKYLRDEIIQLCFRRWEIENYYRDEKTTLKLEKFHSKTTNGILQEFYAAMIMSVITRTLMALSSQWYFSG